MLKNIKPKLKTMLLIVSSGIVGYAYYYFIGCKNGCPIQSNPLMSTLYGALLGGILSIPAKSKKENN